MQNYWGLNVGLHVRLEFRGLMFVLLLTWKIRHTFYNLFNSYISSHFLSFTVPEWPWLLNMFGHLVGLLRAVIRSSRWQTRITTERSRPTIETTWPLWRAVLNCSSLLLSNNTFVICRMESVNGLLLWIFLTVLGICHLVCPSDVEVKYSLLVLP